MVIFIYEKKEKKYETRGNGADFVDFLQKADTPRKWVLPRAKIDTHKKLNFPHEYPTKKTKFGKMEKIKKWKIRK